MTTEFQSINLTGWILLGVLVALAAIFLAFWVSKQRWTASRKRCVPVSEKASPS